MDVVELENVGMRRHDTPCHLCLLTANYAIKKQGEVTRVDVDAAPPSFQRTNGEVTERVSADLRRVWRERRSMDIVEVVTSLPRDEYRVKRGKE